MKNTLARTSAIIAALGLTATALTGCGSKDPDDALCDDFRSVIKELKIKNENEMGELMAKDPEKAQKFGTKIKKAASEHEDSKYSEVFDVLGGAYEQGPKLMENMTDPKSQQKLQELQKKVQSEDYSEKMEKFDDECPIPES